MGLPVCSERKAKGTVPFFCFASMILMGCSFRETAFTGGTAQQRDAISCDTWQAGTPTSCSIYGADLIARGEFLVVDTMGYEIRPYEEYEGRLAYSFLGRTKYVPSKKLYLLPFDVTLYAYGQKAGFAKITEPCRTFLMSNPVSRIVEIIDDRPDDKSVTERFARYLHDAGMAEIDKTPHVVASRVGGNSDGAWLLLTWTSGGSTYDGSLIGNCWGFFSRHYMLY